MISPSTVRASGAAAGWRSNSINNSASIRFFAEHLPASRKGTAWDRILQVLVTYRLIAPGSEWHLHREWFQRTALADLLGGDFALAEIHRLYECLDHVLSLKDQLFAHLRERWSDLFGAKYDILLYDLTSTYFEIAVPQDPDDKRKHGYSRDHRSDCPQVVIALVITPEGYPLAYEVLPGNTADKTTLREFLAKIEVRYGKARRIWLMDRAYAPKVWGIDASSSVRKAGSRAARFRFERREPLPGCRLRTWRLISRRILRWWAASSSRTWLWSS